MLSILIPTHNYVCAHLVCELQKQCEEAQALLGGNFTYEIIVADDGSTDAATIEKNAVIDYLPSCRFIESDRNIGRAAIRNLLIRESRGQWLLIIDADAEVITDDFIHRYLKAATTPAPAAAPTPAPAPAAGVPTPSAAPTPSAVPTPSAAPAAPTIIVGGLKNPPEAPAGSELRYRYELASDSLRTLQARRQQPAMFFSTFNFMATRTVFDHIRFDERCTDYGYEDALLGIEAERRGFPIIHIDNPLQHNGINTNAAFLRNSETALRTLRRLGPPMTDRARVAQAAKRLTTPKWRRYTLRPLIIILYKMSRPLLRRNLLSSHPNLHLFAFYKLGYYLTLATPGRPYPF